MTRHVTLFLFVKGTAASPVENLVNQGQCAATLDTLEKLRAIPEIGEIVVATSSSEFAGRLADLPVHVETDPIDKVFHWGKYLAHLVAQYQAEFPLYVGGGSGVLMSRDDWKLIVERVLNEQNLLITNNLYSSDFAAWVPGSALFRIEPPAVDNDLAFRLSERAGLAVSVLPKNAATQLDIDTPTDLLTIALHSGVGRQLGAFLRQANLETARVEQMRSRMQDPQMTTVIAGRVSASVGLFLERSTRCQWRIFSEERGMRASGRDQRGQVRSLLGMYLDKVGPGEFVNSLAQLADAAIIDTRVLFAHRRLHPTAPDRFYSDLVEPGRIHDPFIRELTQAVREASIPILLGGHSLVSGGMFSIAES